MSRRRALSLAAFLVLALPASAGAHAALLRTVPSASGTVNGSPGEVRLTYSEAVEPRFAIVSVTDAAGHRVTSAPPARNRADATELDVPLRHLDRGWYLVYWRVISADGHPVRGAFTFAVGPNAGPAPQFAIPSLSETAATPELLVARWIVLLALLCGVGLLAFRLAIARPLPRRVPGVSLRAVSVALAISLTVALVATLVYVDLSTAEFAQLGAFDLGSLVPLMRDSAFGRGYLDLAGVEALLCFAAWAAVWVARPDRERRTVAELLAGIGVLAACGAALTVPGVAGHAAQYTPRGVSLLLDAVHMAAAAVWIGGLAGLSVVAWRAGTRRVASMVVLVPRFSNVALAATLLLIASGTVAAIIRLPTLSSMWETGYGQALLVKIGLLLLALTLAAVNLLRTKPRLQASERRPGLGEPTTQTLRRLVGAEQFLVVGAVFAAGVMSSLAPPPKALSQEGKAEASIGPGAVTRTISKNGYDLRFEVTPNRAAVPNAFAVRITKDGKPVTGANVVATFTMLDMEMGQQAYALKERSPSVYEKRSLPSLVMVGHWGLDFSVSPPGAKPFEVLLLDKAEG